MARAARRMRLEVTAKDIRMARHCLHCPVALALKRVGFNWPVVHAERSESEGLRIRHSRRVSDFIRAFDAGRKVRPFVAFVEVR